MVKENYELRVGLFTLFAIFLLCYGWGWLKSFSLFDPPQIFWVRFHDVAGLNNNATVNIQGVRVGTVDQISFKLPDGLTDIPEKNRESIQQPKVYARVKITGAKLPIPKTSEITIQTLGMVGAKYIEITLPEENKQQEEFIQANSLVEGKDPVRVELVVNNFARKLSSIAEAITSDEASSTIKNVAQAAQKLNKTMDKLPNLADSLKLASDQVGSTAHKFANTAEHTQELANNANKFFVEGKGSLNSVTTLAQGLAKTNNKVGKILDNPSLTQDLKETLHIAQQTAQTVQFAITELSGTLKNSEVRQDVLSMLNKLQNSSEDIRQSVQVVGKLANNDGLRTDVKDIVQDAKEALNKANLILSDTSFRSDLSGTMGKIKTAANDVDTAAKQLNQILNKRSPLLHMIFGKPGELAKEKTKETLKDGTAVNTSGTPL